jgi:hypothetical protein
VAGNEALFDVLVQAVAGYKLLVIFTERNKLPHNRGETCAFKTYNIKPAHGVHKVTEISVLVPAGTRIIDVSYNTETWLYLNVASATGKGTAWSSPH